MLPIRKERAPRELLDARRRIKGTPDATLSWRNITHEERSATLCSLLEEQGSLCAYCMRSISEHDAHVEHIIPQSEAQGADDPASVDYQNLLAVCDGFAGNAMGQTCDRARGNRPLAISPLKSEQIERIKYRRDGTIYSEDDELDVSLGAVLNLNQPLLKRNRKAVLEELYRRLDRKGRRGRQSVASFCSRYVDEHLAHADRRIPYDGIVIYFMRKRINASG